MKALEYIGEKEKEAEKLNREIAAIQKIQEQFNDLEIHTDRWGTKRYCSAQVNEIADKFMSKFNCGCCGDSPFEVWPYKEIEGIKIYSNPPYYWIGEKDSWDEDRDVIAKPEWFKGLRTNNISEELIKKIASHLEYKGADVGNWGK